MLRDRLDRYRVHQFIDAAAAGCGITNEAANGVDNFLPTAIAHGNVDVQARLARSGVGRAAHPLRDFVR